MAVSSLTKMTVPLASDQSSPTQGLLMPKLKYRFRVIFENFGVTNPRTELTKQVIDFSRPNVEFSNIDIPIYNSTIKLAGKHTWGDLSCKIRDDAGGNVSRLIGEQLQKQFDFMEQASASAGIDYKFLTRIEMLDGGNGTNTPVILETWELYGCYVDSTTYSALSYTGAADVAMIDLSIQYDNAQQIGPGAGIGTEGFNQKRAGTATTGGGVPYR